MDYANFLNEKKVIVVGPAPTIVNSKQHDFIESHDVVVRINRALPIHKELEEDIGSRTDVLYNCLNPSPVCGGKQDFTFWQSKIKWLCSPYPEIHPFDKDIRRTKAALQKYNIPFHIIDKKYYLEIVNEIKTRPNSGICAILDLLYHNISSLHITGFTFLKGGYYKQYRDISEKELQLSESKGSHKQTPQINLMRRLFNQDSRLSGDLTLMNILSGNV